MKKRTPKKPRASRLKWIVLVNEIGQFWNGRKWVDEYPDAKQYKTIEEAHGQRVLALFKALRVTMWANYGMEDQREV